MTFLVLAMLLLQSVQAHAANGFVVGMPSHEHSMAAQFVAATEAIPVSLETNMAPKPAHVAGEEHAHGYALLPRSPSPCGLGAVSAAWKLGNERLDGLRSRCLERPPRSSFGS